MNEKDTNSYKLKIALLTDKNIELQEKIDKAIEYIKSRAKKAGVQLMPREKELLEILGDGNNE